MKQERNNVKQERNKASHDMSMKDSKCIKQERGENIEEKEDDKDEIHVKKEIKEENEVSQPNAVIIKERQIR